MSKSEEGGLSSSRSMLQSGSQAETELAALLADLRRSRQPIDAYLKSASPSASAPRSEAALRALENSALFDLPIKSRCEALAHLLSRRTEELERQNQSL